MADIFQTPFSIFFFLKETFYSLSKISLIFQPEGPVGNKS